MAQFVTAACKAGSLLADSGYFSEANVEACAGAGVAPLIAHRRERHHLSWQDRFAQAPPAPENATPLEAMRHRLATPEGQQTYALRKQTPEPVVRHHQIGDGLPAILATRPRQGQGRMEPSHPGLEREANVRLATRLKTAVVLVRRIVRRPCRSELRLFLAPPESFCLSNPFAGIVPVKIRARREAASPSYPRAAPRSGPQSDRLLGVLTNQPQNLVPQFDRQNIHDLGDVDAIFVGTLLDILLNLIAWLVFITDEIEA